MTYSCGIFPSLDADLKSPDELANEDALHEAQVRKIQHIIARADIRPGHRVRFPCRLSRSAADVDGPVGAGDRVGLGRNGARNHTHDPRHNRRHAHALDRAGRICPGARTPGPLCRRRAGEGQWHDARGATRWRPDPRTPHGFPRDACGVGRPVRQGRKRGDGRGDW